MIYFRVVILNQKTQIKKDKKKTNNLASVCKTEKRVSSTSIKDT